MQKRILGTVVYRTPSVCWSPRAPAGRGQTENVTGTSMRCNVMPCLSQPLTHTHMRCVVVSSEHSFLGERQFPVARCVHYSRPSSSSIACRIRFTWPTFDIPRSCENKRRESTWALCREGVTVCSRIDGWFHCPNDNNNNHHNHNSLEQECQTCGLLKVLIWPTKLVRVF